MRGIPLLAENRLASQEGLCFLERVSKKDSLHGYAPLYMEFNFTLPPHTIQTYVIQRYSNFTAVRKL